MSYFKNYSLPTNGENKLQIYQNLNTVMWLRYCQTQKTANTWKISGMLIVYWPITIKFRIRKQTSKPQINYRCCLRFSYLVPYWLISRNTIAFHKYLWCSGFYEFHNTFLFLNNQFTISTEAIMHLVYPPPQKNCVHGWNAVIWIYHQLEKLVR